MNFNGLGTNYIEYKVGFDDKDAIPQVFEFFISWYPAKKRVHFKTSNTLIDFFDKTCASFRTITRNPVKD